MTWIEMLLVMALLLIVIGLNPLLARYSGTVEPPASSFRASSHVQSPTMDRKYWQKQLREAELELEAATRRTDVNAAAARLMLAKRELKRLEMIQPNPPAVPPSGAQARCQLGSLAVARRALPHNLRVFVDLET
jgi:hypothetical protein